MQKYHVFRVLCIQSDMYSDCHIFKVSCIQSVVYSGWHVINAHVFNVVGGAKSKAGWAFGLGLERLAMKLYNVPDVRLFWSEDPGFLSQFNVSDCHTPITYKVQDSSYTVDVIGVGVGVGYLSN